MLQSYDHKALFKLPNSKLEAALEAVLRSFKNHVDNRRWVGGLKFVIFVQVQYIKMSTRVGGWSKKRKIMSTWLLNDP